MREGMKAQGQISEIWLCDVWIHVWARGFWQTFQPKIDFYDVFKYGKRFDLR